jgi:hypothetical protein
MTSTVTCPIASVSENGPLAVWINSLNVRTSVSVLYDALTVVLGKMR